MINDVEYFIYYRNSICGYIFAGNIKEYLWKGFCKNQTAMSGVASMGLWMRCAMETDQSSIYFIRYVVTRRTKDAGIAATEPEGTSEMTSFGMVQSSSPETAHHRSFWVETEVRMKSELGEKTILFVQRS